MLPIQLGANDFLVGRYNNDDGWVAVYVPADAAGRGSWGDGDRNFGGCVADDG